MDSLTVSIPGSLRRFVEEQAARAGFDTPDAYVASLLDDQRKRAAKARLEELLMEGLNSGPPIEVDDAFWEEKLRRYDERFGEDDAS